MHNISQSVVCSVLTWRSWWYPYIALLLPAGLLLHLLFCSVFSSVLSSWACLTVTIGGLNVGWRSLKVAAAWASQHQLHIKWAVPLAYQAHPFPIPNLPPQPCRLPCWGLSSEDGAGARGAATVPLGWHRLLLHAHHGDFDIYCSFFAALEAQRICREPWKLPPRNSLGSEMKFSCIMSLWSSLSLSQFAIDLKSSLG